MVKKTKTHNLLLVITSLLGYLEWGDNNHAFLFQAEGEIIVKLFTDPDSVLHPFILLPMAGQALLLVTLFQKNPGKVLTYVGMGSLALLLVFMFLIGLMSWNFKIVLSALPFIVVAVMTINGNKKKDGDGIGITAVDP